MLDKQACDKQFLPRIPEETVKKMTVRSDGPLLARSGADPSVSFWLKELFELAISSFTQNR